MLRLSFLFRATVGQDPQKRYLLLFKEWQHSVI
jgi:hypothetical protein